MPKTEAEDERQSDLIALESMFDSVLPAATQSKTEILTCRVPSEKNQATKLWCEENGISFSDWVRSKLYDEPLPRKSLKRVSVLDRQICSELGAIGRNLNQILRKFNSQPLPRLRLDDRHLLEALLKKLTEIREKLAE